ncbi:MAG: threonine--tRNA ligase [Fidelibacterota bacterium]
MKEITLTVPGNPPRTYPAGTPASKILQDIDPDQAKDAVAVKVNGELRDWHREVDSDAELEAVAAHSPGGHDILLHSAAHLMAQAVKELFPGTRITIGPTIENRFYYDFDREESFTEEDLDRIEERMREIAERDLHVERRVVSRDEVRKFFEDLGEAYKLELIDEMGDDEVITTYSQGDFVDLCRGPHLPSTGMIKHFKLLSIAGAYWRGDENNKMLQRIYGTAFPDEEGLQAYLNQLEKARERDHRKLGKELGLFQFDPVSSGSPFFLPRGTVVYLELVDHIRTLYREYGYQEVISPQIYDIDLWKTSGHLNLFGEFMYQMKLGKRQFALKPMNCPAHALIYSSELRSYRDLPLRLADFGRLHRYEKAGVVSGLTRVRSFSQDDAHIFCTPDQIGGEMEALFGMIHRVYDVFGFDDIEVALSTRPEKALGERKLWDEAEELLQNTLEELEQDFRVDSGEGVFYGPKIDFHVQDALGRTHQLGTFQLDFNLPERFGLEFIDRDGGAKRPVMIHRAILGSIERFFGVYLEHCGGDFPLWLAPVQVIVLPISEKVGRYARQVRDTLHGAGLRVEMDDRTEKIGAKIRHAELQKINVMLIVGEKEVRDQTVSVRRRFTGDEGVMSLDEVIESLTAEIKERRRGPK